MVKGIKADEWREVPGYDGKYQINYMSKMRRKLKNGECKEMNPYTKRNGTRVIKLNGKEMKVSKIMQLTFIGKLKDGYVIYHKNGIKHEDYLGNLEVISRRELGLRTGQISRVGTTIAKIDSSGEIVELYRSAREAGRKNFMSYQSVLDRANGKVKGIFASDGYAYVYDNFKDIENVIKRIKGAGVKHG
ncbi:MAG: hypothetical protein R3Y24_13875 [Eubacteriales bacterium]